MSDKDLLGNIKKLRELTGVGFKDCKIALDETSGDIEKSIEYLRKKGIAKASKKMSRTASEGLALVKEAEGNISIIEINSETDFVAKNQDFINFCKELSEINFKVKADIDKLNETKMNNGNIVKDNLVNLIAKIGEKITIRRADFYDSSKGTNFCYVHSALEKGIGKIIAIVKLEGIVKEKNHNIGSKVAMHIAAAVQTPVVALFGPSSEWSWRPWRCQHELVLGQCSCKRTRNFVCDKTRPFPCMEGIQVSNVLDAINSISPPTKRVK